MGDKWYTKSSFILVVIILGSIGVTAIMAEMPATVKLGHTETPWLKVTDTLEPYNFDYFATAEFPVDTDSDTLDPLAPPGENCFTRGRVGPDFETERHVYNRSMVHGLLIQQAMPSSPPDTYHYEIVHDGSPTGCGCTMAGFACEVDCPAFTVDSGDFLILCATATSELAPATYAHGYMKIFQGMSKVGKCYPTDTLCISPATGDIAKDICEFSGGMSWKDKMGGMCMVL